MDQRAAPQRPGDSSTDESAPGHEKQRGSGEAECKKAEVIGRQASQGAVHIEVLQTGNCRTAGAGVFALLGLLWLSQMTR